MRNLRTAAEQNDILGMNIDHFLELYGFRGCVEHMGFADYFVMYRKSTKKIISVSHKTDGKPDYKKPHLYKTIGGGHFVRMSKTVRVAPFPTAQNESGKPVLL